MTSAMKHKKTAMLSIAVNVKKWCIIKTWDVEVAL